MRALKRVASPDCKSFPHPHAKVDQGPDERWQHSGRILRLTDRAGVVAAEVAEEHVLDALFLSGVLTPAERAAGLRFFSDYRAAGLMERVVGSYAFTRSTSRGADPWGDERSDAQEAAYQRWRLALRSLGTLCAEVVQKVACDGAMPCEKERPRLKRGLLHLVAWYRL